MSSVPEVGSGQVAIFPVFKGFRKATEQEATRSTASAAGIFRSGFTKAGADAGIGFSKSFGSSSAAGFKELTAAASKAAREVSAARLKEQDAAGRLRIAEAQLLETRAKYSAESSQVIRAEERLATAQRALQTVQSGVAASTDRLAAAKRDLAAAAASANSAGERSNSVFSRLGGVFSNGGREGAARFSQGFKDVLGGVLGANILTGIGYTIGRTIGDGARAGIGYTLDSIGLASELQQTTGAAAAVFKDQVGFITEEARTAATEVGLTRSAYQKFATVVGAQLKNLGVRTSDVATRTDDLIDLGADLAAQFGGSTADAVAALSSLLRGERDPIERYGVSLKQVDIDAEKARLGLVGLTGEADKQADITATLGLLWAQTADAQGRFAAESDTYAGKQQRLLAQLEDQQTRLGEALLPTATDLLQFANDDLLPILEGAIDESGPTLVASIREVMPEIKGLVATAADNLPGAINAAVGFGGFLADSFEQDFGRGNGGVGDPAVWEGLTKAIDDSANGFTEWRLSLGALVTDESGLRWVSGQERLLEYLQEKNEEKSDAIKAYWATSLDELRLMALQAREGMFGAGTEFAAGFEDGITTGTEKVALAAERMALAARDKVVGTMLIQSPSRVMRELGRYLPQGLALGMDDESWRVSRSIEQMLALPSQSNMATPGGGSARGGIRDINISNPDPLVVLAMLNQELGGRLAI